MKIKSVGTGIIASLAIVTLLSIGNGGVIVPAYGLENETTIQISVSNVNESTIRDYSPFKETILNKVVDIQDSPYLNDILWAYEQGITNGTGETTFSPDGKVTAQQMCCMMARAYFPEETAGMDAEQIMLFMGRNTSLPINIIDYRDIEYIRYTAYDAILSHHNIEIFDKELYENGEAPCHATEIMNEYQLMSDLGIEYRPGYTPITRGELVHILYELHTNKDKYIEIIPENTLRVDIHSEDSVELSDYLIQLKNLPDEIINRFNNRNWKVELDPGIIYPYCESKGFTDVSGLCSYKNKTLYLLNPYSTYHEFGHFYMYTSNIDSKIQSIFNAEHGESSCLSDYSNTNMNEYFAEAFDYWISNRENEEKMSELMESNPKTYELLHRLEQNNWKGLMSYD